MLKQNTLNTHTLMHMHTHTERERETEKHLTHRCLVTLKPDVTILD